MTNPPSAEELVERIARAIYSSGMTCEPWEGMSGAIRGRYLRYARAALESLTLDHQRLQREIGERDERIAALEKALEPFAEAERLARQMVRENGVTLAVLDRIAAYYVSWPNYSSARAILSTGTTR